MLPLKILKDYKVLTLEEAKGLYESNVRSKIFVCSGFLAKGTHSVHIEGGQILLFTNDPVFLELKKLCPTAESIESFLNSKIIKEKTLHKLIYILTDIEKDEEEQPAEKNNLVIPADLSKEEEVEVEVTSVSQVKIETKTSKKKP